MCGFIVQLVEHRTGIAEVTVSNPAVALILFRLLLSNCSSWKMFCDANHSSLSTLIVTLKVHIKSRLQPNSKLRITSKFVLAKKNWDYVHFNFTCE